MKYKMLGFDSAEVMPWVEQLDRLMAQGRAAYAQRVEAALTPHAAHLGEVVLEQRADLHSVQTLRCAHCQSAVELWLDDVMVTRG